MDDFEIILEDYPDTLTFVTLPQLRQRNVKDPAKQPDYQTHSNLLPNFDHPFGDFDFG